MLYVLWIRASTRVFRYINELSYFSREREKKITDRVRTCNKFYHIIINILLYNVFDPHKIVDTHSFTHFYAVWRDNDYIQFFI